MSENAAKPADDSSGGEAIGKAAAPRGRKPVVGGLEPAQSIITKLGGPGAVAAILGIHRTRVSSWKAPKVAGGTGGTIPAKHIDALMRHAAAASIELRYAEFFVQGQRELDLDWRDPVRPGASDERQGAAA